jgi:putative component of toxin-antitoxin plasmid stabilization module
MFIVKQLPEFAQWLIGLKDGMTHRRLARRLEKGAARFAG